MKPQESYIVDKSRNIGAINHFRKSLVEYQLNTVRFKKVKKNWFGTAAYKICFESGIRNLFWEVRNGLFTCHQHRPPDHVVKSNDQRADSTTNIFTVFPWHQYQGTFGGIF